MKYRICGQNAEHNMKLMSNLSDIMSAQTQQNFASTFFAQRQLTKLGSTPFVDVVTTVTLKRRIQAHICNEK